MWNVCLWNENQKKQKIVAAACTFQSYYERNTSFRYLVNVASWKANTTKLSSVGLRLNASKSESMLAKHCCLSANVTWQELGFGPVAVKLILSLKIFQLIEISNISSVLSFVDDLIESRCCKCESSLCATIHWGSSWVFGFVLFHPSVNPESSKCIGQHFLDSGKL